MDIQQEINRLKTIATKQKVSNTKIAEITGLTNRTIGNFFKLEHKPSFETYLKIAKALDLSITYKPTKSRFKKVGEINGQPIYISNYEV